MARHLLIGNNVARNYTSNVLDDKAIDVQKLSSAGPTSLVAGEGIADSEQIRIVQGTGAAAIVSPWFYGKDVIVWGGRSADAQDAQVSTVTIATNANADEPAAFLKLINLTDGQEPFEFKNYEVKVTSGDVAATIATALFNLINADKPHWIKTVADSGGGVLTFTGFKKGEPKADGSIQSEVALFDVVDNFDGDFATTATFATTTPAFRGFGDGFYVREMEEEVRGVTYGFYNRIQQPNTPDATSVTGTVYDMYHIVATKDGSSASQIHGVDNLIEIYIAFDPTDGAKTGLLEAQLNGYMGSVNFAPVNL